MFNHGNVSFYTVSVINSLTCLYNFVTYGKKLYKFICCKGVPLYLEAGYFLLRHNGKFFFVF